MEHPLKASASNKAEIMRLIDANAKSLAPITSGSGTAKTTASGICNLPDKVKSLSYQSTEKTMFTRHFHKSRCNRALHKGRL